MRVRAGDMSVLQLEVASVSHCGRVRDHNEDWTSVDRDAGVAVLADGMGGHNAGEVASRMAAEVVMNALARERAQAGPLGREHAEALVGTQIAAANAAVYEASCLDRRHRGMGTTLVVALWHDEGVTWGHVGDSRLYLMRAGALTRLTRDHSVVQEQLERGAITADDARHSMNRNVLTRAVGIEPDVQAEVRSHEVLPRDLYLLCSDGLTEMLTDTEIREALRDCNEDLAAAARRLVDRANEAGGADNVSVILVRADATTEGVGP